MSTTKLCAQCDKPLQRDGAGEPVTIKMTGETICGACLMDMMESKAPSAEDNIEVKDFTHEAIIDLASKAGVFPDQISLCCKQFRASDVEIKIVDNIYTIIYLYDLIEDRKRWSLARDYLVAWMNQHPLRRQAWPVLKSANQMLSSDGRFLFIFLPGSFPQPPTDWVVGVAQELCRGINPGKLGWRVCSVTTTSEQETEGDINDALLSWAETQSHPETLKCIRKSVKFPFAEERCSCVIVQR